jgi:hypothetical protein
MRLEPNESKNREGREFPLIPRLREVLEEHAAKRLELEKRTGTVVVPLFFRYSGTKAGQRIRDWREDYNKTRPHSSLRQLTPVAFAGGGDFTQGRVQGRNSQS